MFTAPDAAAILPKLGDRARDKVFVEDLTFLISRPDRADKLLDHPEVHEASRRDDYMPYWAELWPDYDASALAFAADNARLNGFTNFQTLQLDWRTPPPDLKVGLILGSDLIYEARNVAPVIACIQSVLLPGGQALITDQNRVPADAFQVALAQADLHFTTQAMKAGQPGGKREKGTLYRIRRPV
jgi:hypothetical protein